MKITIKIKYLLGIAVCVLGFLSIFTFRAAAEGPKAYVRYTDAGQTVLASVYWNDTNGYTFEWANDMLPDNSDLNWSSASSGGVTWHGKGSDKAYVNIALEKYKNYYFKVSKDDQITIVRSYPGDIASENGPVKRSSDYAHGNFTPDTTMCGACHDTHSSIKSQLLKQSTYYDLCMLCHSNSNSQSKYDVELGKTYMGPDAGWSESLAGPIGTGAASSAHDINDNFNTTVNVPGGSPESMLTFTCLSCHTAHGGTNDNYRLLRKQIYPSNSETEPTQVEFKAFSIVKNNLTVGEQVYLKSGSSEFCLACHKDYTPGSLSTGHLTYEHPVTVGASVYGVNPAASRNLFPSIGDYLPLQYNEGAQNIQDKRTAIVCETCHYAHGTRKSYVIDEGAWTQESFNQAIANGQNNAGAGKNMLRLDNYGVCQSCHKK